MTKNLRNYLSFIFFLITVLAHGTVLEGLQADQFVKGSKQVFLNEQSNIPKLILFKEESQPKFDSPDLWLKLNFGMQSGLTLNLISSDRDNIGFTHYRYIQFLDGKKLDGTMWIIHVKNDKVISMNGLLFDNVKVNSIPSLSEADALSKALAKINAIVYKWQIPSEEIAIKKILNDPNATYTPKGQLLYAYNTNKPNEINYRLCYRFDIYSQEPLGRKYISVDAITGEIIDIQDRIWESNANGTAVTGYAGTQPIISDSFNGSFRLREANRGAGQGMETYNMLTGTNYGSAVDFTDGDNFWNNANAARDQYATDAHFAAERTYDYYFNTYGRNSINNAGLKLLSFVHYSSNYVNAFWDGSVMTYGDGNASFTPLTSLDIGGHEITHGLTSFTADLVYSYESGALNESFSDCFGTSIEWYADPGHADWLIGEDIGGAFRSHSNPNAYGDPDTYQGFNWFNGSGDNGGVHTNSGVQNYWFYLLSVGGSGTNDIGNAFSVNGQGITKAAAIAYRTLTNYLTTTSQYIDARNYSIQASIDLFGACSPEMFATIDAWYAVGVGGTANTPTTITNVTPTTICSGDSVLITSKAPFGSTYSWYRDNVLINGATNPVYYATSSGEYTLTTNNCGNIYNSNKILVNVINLQPSISPSGNASDCNSVTLTANNTSGYSLQWNKDGSPLIGASSQTYVASRSGNYSLTISAIETPGQSMSNSLQVNIPDFTCSNPAFSAINVAGLPSTIPTNGITIQFSLTHTYDGDIDIMLEAPNGDLLGISHNAGGNGQNFTNTIISDAASNSVNAGTAPFTGSFKPWPVTFASCITTTKTSFSSIGNGTINPNGTWKLRVYDRYNIDIGTINNWTITFPSTFQPSPNCGPVATAPVAVSIGNDVDISFNPTSNVKYTLTEKNLFSGVAHSFGTAATIDSKGYYGFGDGTNSDWWEYNPVNDSWTQKNSAPTGYNGAASFTIGTDVYVVGGLNGTYSNKVYQWNSIANSWTQKNNFPGGARSNLTAVASGGKGYVLCGNDAANAFNDIWEYTPGTDLWTFKANVPGVAGRKNMSAFVILQRIYFGLGQSCAPCIVNKDWFEYDIQNNTVNQKNNFSGSARENANGFAISNKGYVIFGNSGSTTYSDYWEYDALQDLWTQKGLYGGLSRTGASSTVIRNRAYIFGGKNSGVSVKNVTEFKTVSVICTNTAASVTLEATNGISYLWNTGATTQSISGISNGEYSVTVTNQSCAASALRDIEVYSVPSSNVTNNSPLMFCEGNNVTLSADLANSYVWNTGEVTKNIVVSASGTYTVTVTGPGGCTKSSTPIPVTVYPLPPVTVISSGNTAFCEGGNVSLTPYSYLTIPFAPLPGSGTPVTLADDQLTGALPIGFNFTFFGNAYSNFYISSNGFISFGNTGSGCCTGQLLPNPTTPNNLIAFAWTDLYPPAGGSIEYFTTGEIPNRKLVVKYNNIRHYPSGNLVTAQVILFESTNQIEIHTAAMPTDGTLHTMGLENANGTQAVIIPGRNRASFSIANEAIRFTTQITSYQWSNGLNSQAINVNTTGTYSVSVTDANGCVNTSPPVNVTVHPIPIATITPNGSTTICNGSNVVLSANTVAFYLWSTGATTQNITVSSAGTYSVTVSTSHGCTKNSAPVTVTVNPCSINLNMKLFIEGFYTGGGLMNASVDPVGHPTLCDTITIELHNPTPPYGIAFSVKSTINTSGNGLFVFPGGALSNSYYIVVKHRNALQTWSASPVMINSNTTYDFTTSANKAFGNNMIQSADHVGWCLFSGDISDAVSGFGNQDGVIESQDYSDMENAVYITKLGYVFEDITGDQVVESLDYSIMENNVVSNVFVNHP